MKRHILSLATTAALISISLCSCNESYISPEYHDPNDSIYNGVIIDHIPVMLSMSDPHYVTVTKGGGPIVSDAEWVKERAEFNIYSFLTNNFAYKGEIDYTKTFKPEGELPEDEVMQCLIDDPETGMGAPARLINGVNLEFIKNDTSYYYSFRNQDYKYNFFAYHIDDAVVKNNTATRQNDRIFMDINIDGTQDVITAYAELQEEQLDHIDHDYDKWLYVNLLNRELVYSTLSGHRMIYPIFNASHQLARFRFNLRGEEQMLNNIYIEDIYIKAHRDWRLTVAADNFENIGLEMIGEERLQEVHLCDTIGEIDGSKKCLEPDYYKVERYGEINDLGMGMMLPARENYDLYIKCAYLDDNNRWRTYTAGYTLNYRDEESGENTNRGFVAGGLYDINIHIYGYQKVQLEMDGLGWGTPIKIPIDEEDAEIFE